MPAYSVRCPEHGDVELTPQEYETQLPFASKLCPKCKAEACFDYDVYELSTAIEEQLAEFSQAFPHIVQWWRGLALVPPRREAPHEKGDVASTAKAVRSDGKSDEASTSQSMPRAEVLLCKVLQVPVRAWRGHSRMGHEVFKQRTNSSETYELRSRTKNTNTAHDGFCQYTGVSL